MIRNSQVAAELGYLDLPRSASDRKRPVARPARESPHLFTTGSQGEPLSALHRVALNDHKSIKITPGDTVISLPNSFPATRKRLPI